MSTRIVLFAIPCLLVDCLAGAARADLLVLDAAGGGDFSTLQQVVDGAAAGDIVLVRPGDYTGPFGVTFGGKSLTILADGTGPVEFPSLRITNIQVGQTFVLRGVRLPIQGPPGDSFAFLQVDTSPGAVFIEDCFIAGQPGGSIVPMSTAVNASVANVFFESCEIVGADGIDDGTGPLGKTGGWGLKTLAAHVTLSNCTVTGGAGGSETHHLSGPAGTGGEAIRAVATELFVSGCTVTAGDGGHDTGTPALGGGAGGSALVADAASVVTLRDDVLTGGAGGTDDSGVQGPAGADLDAPVVVTYRGPARTLHVEAPLVEGGAGQVLATGEPGELVLVLVSLDGAWTPTPKFEGTLLVGAPAAGPFILGTLDGAGFLQAGVVIPELGLPGAGLRVITQAIVTSGSSVVLGDASAAVLLGGP